MFIELQYFFKNCMKLPNEFKTVAVVFLIVCIMFASPGLFSRENVLGKIMIIVALITTTCYNRIAGIITLIVIISMLNQLPIKEGLANPLTSLTGATPAPSAPSAPPAPPAHSFNTPDEFRQKYCLRGVPDPKEPGVLKPNYMLSLTLFDGVDASGNVTYGNDTLKVLGRIDNSSLKNCAGQNGIEKVCDPKCNWKMEPPSPTSAPSDNATEGFTQVLRSHIRNGTNLLTSGINDIKSSATRIKRQLF